MEREERRLVDTVTVVDETQMTVPPPRRTLDSGKR